MGTRTKFCNKNELKTNLKASKAQIYKHSRNSKNKISAYIRNSPHKLNTDLKRDLHYTKANLKSNFYLSKGDDPKDQSKTILVPTIPLQIQAKITNLKTKPRSIPRVNLGIRKSANCLNKTFYHKFPKSSSLNMLKSTQFKKIQPLPIFTNKVISREKDLPRTRYPRKHFRSMSYSNEDPVRASQNSHYKAAWKTKRAEDDYGGFTDFHEYMKYIVKKENRKVHIPVKIKQ
ncbi:unnamed protein product [Moneuplotes crassus]|uniref:Uncharacterized protein n=1 Tax=Euplotes crassus TaxID=5936 RepID=A0AAD1X8M6_EUPCR|nr:unnamed protein product [Moneuplotes crassus]